MNVCYQATRNFYPKLLPSLHSLLDHNEVEHLYILAEDDTIPGVPDGTEVINVTDQLFVDRGSPNFKTPFSYMVLLRVVMASLLPVDKVISLDADTIICDSLLPLWYADMKDKWFAAVPEHKGKWKPFGEKYYNAGVMVYNLAQIRKDKIEPIWLKRINTESLIYCEQDLFNL